jgi:hypothetical protein
MKQSMVEVFNQLTHDELTGYTSFESILGNHFEKFRHFYYSTCIVPSNLSESVKNVSCFCNDGGLLVSVEFKTAKSCKAYKECIDSHSDDIEDHFSFNTEISKSKTLNISIENNGISREGELYEDNTDTN